jgi:competence protein ComEA
MRSIAALAAAVTLGLAAPAAAEERVAAPRPVKVPAAESKVDVNAASETELATVPGIGASLARRIVAFREQHGPFVDVDGLLKVQGIGEKSLEKLRPDLTAGKAR